MTKATATAEPPAGPVKELFRGDVPIHRIKVEINFRRHFDEKKLQELADNIKKVGVLEPVLARPAGSVEQPKGHYILIAGERRLRAAKLAGLEEIPVRVLEVDEKQAAELQALENLHREDLGPIEEAQAFKTLLDQGSYDVKALAERVDKSEAYVYRSMKLLDLGPDVQKLIDAGKLTPAHGHQLLRVEQGKQKDLASHCVNNRETVADLRDTIERQIGKDLAKAPFPKDVPYAGQQACAKCPFNSGNQTDLFDKAEGGRCTGPGCFTAKMEHFVNEFAAREVEKRPGMTFLGIQEHYGCRTPQGLQRIGADDPEFRDPKLQKLMKAEPEKFQFAVEGPDFTGKPRVLVFARAEAIRKAIPKFRVWSSGSSGYKESALDLRIRKGVSRAILDAVAEKSKAIGREHWLSIIRSLHSSQQDAYIFEIYGVKTAKKAYEVPDLSKVSQEDLAAIAVLKSIFGYSGVDKDKAARIGVDTKKVVQAATVRIRAEEKAKKAKAGKGPHETV